MRYNIGFFRHHIQRLLKGNHVRDFFSNVISKFLPKHEIILDVKEKEILEHINSKGFYSLPEFVDNDTINRIRNSLVGAKVYDRYDKEKRLFDPQNPPEYARTGAYLNKDIISCTDIIRLANNETIIRLVSNYLGCKPTLSNITMWHSYSKKDSVSKNSENYHRDVDDFKFIKVFIYLTDVGMNDGPHVFIDGSHNDNKFLKIKRFSDEQIESYYSKERIRYITGKKGDAFIECTYGIHKGLMPKRSGRLVLQFEYSMLQIGAYNYDEKYNSNIDVKYDKYTNRLYVP